MCVAFDFKRPGKMNMHAGIIRIEAEGLAKRRNRLGQIATILQCQS